MNALKTIHTELLREGVHIVPDIETLSTAPNAMILSIGAVAVVNGKIVGEFYQNIDSTNFEDLGFEASASTVDWWSSPERAEARADLQDDQVPLDEALQLFQQWIIEVKGVWIWGYGSDFDVVILKNAFDKMCIQWPFEFWNHRCLRTLAAIHNVRVKREKGAHHNAFADAVNQANTLIECLRQIKMLEFILEKMNEIQAEW